MIIEGQVHGGLTEAFAIAMGQEIRYDEIGNVITGSFQDFFVPTAVETPRWETDHTVTPSPHHQLDSQPCGRELASRTVDPAPSRSALRRRTPATRVKPSLLIAAIGYVCHADCLGRAHRRGSFAGFHRGIGTLRTARHQACETHRAAY
jgi:Molybdopterin-binding domain of aldehyde dehydrogenase